MKSATSDTYTPKAGDVGGTLTVTASYFDGESAPDADATDKTVTAVTAVAVERDTRNKAPVFGDEDPDTTRRAEQRGHPKGGGEHHGHRWCSGCGH